DPDAPSAEAEATDEGAAEPPAPEPEEPESEPAASEPPPVGSPAAARPGLGRRLRRLVLACIVVAILAPIAGVLVYRFLPPPVTFLMVQRVLEGRGLDHRWRPLRRISPALTRAVIAAEDARFCQHRGFDFAAMRQALASNERRPTRIRGGSTI